MGGSPRAASGQRKDGQAQAQQAHAPALHTRKMLGQTHGDAVGALLASVGVECLAELRWGRSWHRCVWSWTVHHGLAGAMLGQRWSRREKVQCLDKLWRAVPLLEVSGIPN